MCIYWLGSNSAPYRFICLSDEFICEFRDAEFFEYVFPLKSKIEFVFVSIPSLSNSMYETKFNKGSSNMHETEK